MRDMPEEFKASLSGSRIGEHVAATVFRGGEMVAEKLAIIDWSYSETLDQQVKGAFSCTIADDTGDLIPYQMDDVLSPAGTVLVVDYVTSAGSFRLGEFTLVESEPQVELYLLDGRVITKTGTVRLSCKDLTADLVADRLLAPESPPKNATVASEIKRLSRDMPVVFAPGTQPTRTVPASVVYEKERMSALDDLAARADGFIRMSPEGGLDIVPLSPTGEPVWQIVGGETGLLMRYESSLSIDGVYNGVVSTSGAGQDASEVLVGKAFETSGPLRWGGPVGYRPLFHSSSLISSQGEADKDAKTRLQNLVAKRMVQLSVECIPNPGLQVGDIVALPLLTDGRRVDTAAIAGRVTSVSLSGDSDGIKPARVGVEVASSDFVQALKSGVWGEADG